MVDNIIKSVAEKLSSLSYIEGIVLGGSRARGTHTEDSDIDIGIYYNSESFDINTINQFATKLDDEHRNNLVVPPGAWGDWINGGGWLVINGYHVDLILRDIKRVEQIMKDTEHGIVTANYQTGHPHGYISAMYRGELAISKILYAKNESLCELKKQAETLQIILQFLPGFLCANKLISRQISNNGVKKSEKFPKISCLICTKHGRLFVVKK